VTDLSPDGPFGQVSTGHLPEDTTVRELVQAAYDRHRHVADGVVATYIPQLADADPAACAASVASVTGSAFEVGDADVRFSIQSVSKPFVLALVVEALGAGPGTCWAPTRPGCPSTPSWPSRCTTTAP
jgi:glutaminase